MTILEKHSLRKKKSIMYLIDGGEYSLGYALLKVEDLYDAGKLIDADYEELAEYIENKMAEVAAEEALIENKETSIEESANEDNEEEE